jgi:hypothetical protein
MNKIKIFFLTLLFINLIACDEDGVFDSNERVTGAGEIKTQELYLDDFAAVDLEGVANVYITTGKKQNVSFTAYENLLKYMKASVVGDELIIKFRDNISVNSVEEIRVDISLEEIEKITLSGVGNFYLTGPLQDFIEIELNGVGNVEAYNLPVYTANVDINGTGNVEVRAKDMLEVDIDGLGNVYYQGAPEITADINGLGEIVNDN